MHDMDEVSQDFLNIINEILRYHREICVLMYKQADMEGDFKRFSVKAEAAREIITGLTQLLPEQKRSEFQRDLNKKYNDLYEAILFKEMTQ